MDVDTDNAGYCLEVLLKSCILICIKWGRLWQLLFAAVMFLHAGNALADTHPKELVLAYGDFFPFEYQAGNSTKGMNVEIVETLAECLGIAIRWERYPWARCIHMAKQGQVDGLLSLYRTAERETFLSFPDENINIDETVLFTFTGSGVVFDGTLQSLTGLKVLVAQANAYGREFDEAVNFIKEKAPNTSNVIKMIARQRYKVGIGSRKTVEAEMMAHGLGNKLIILEPPYHIKTYFAFSRKSQGHEALAKDFSRALTAFKQTGEYERILKKYGYGDQQWPATLGD